VRPIQITNCEHYSIYPCGKVVNTKTGRELKVDLNNCGYRRVTLWSTCQKRKRIMVHRLVAEHYIDKVEGKDWINHKDGNKTNNHFSNLEWCTPSENIKHAFDSGLKRIHNKLDDNIVRGIREMKKENVKLSDIAKHFNIKKSRVSDVLYRKKTYKD